MKDFISKNEGTIIACMMLSGIFLLGLGLDWDQSQIAWRGKISWLPIAAGSLFFIASCIWLASASWGRTRK